MIGQKLPAHTTALFYASILGLLMLIACGTTATEPPQTTPTTESPDSGTIPVVTPQATAEPPAAGSPQRGGVLRFGHYNDVTQFDNQMVASVAFVQPLAPMYSGLINQDWGQEGFPFVGDLAEDWEMSADGLEWTFTIRDNVVAHDGTPVTSQGVAGSLTRLGNGGTNITPLIKNSVESIEAPDSTTVVVNLNGPRPDFLPLLGSENAGIFPDSVIEQLGTDGETIIEDTSLLIGSGGFQFSSFEPGVELEVERFDEYFLDDRPYLDGVSAFIFVDDSTRVAAYLAHQVDMIWGAANSPAMIEQAQQSLPEGVYEQATGSYYWYAQLNPEVELLQDDRVRRAMHLAADRWGGIDAVDLGVGQILGQLPESLGGLTEEEMAGMPAYQEDRAEALEEARRLIQEAGAEGATLQVMAGVRSQYRNAALWYVNNWNEAGLNAVLDTPPDETARNQRQATCEFEVILMRSAVVPLDPNSYLTFWEEGSPDNPCNTPNTELQPLIQQQATQADPEQRRQTVEQIVDMSLESLWVINLHAGGYWYSGWPEVRFNVPNHLTGGLRHLDTWLEE